MSVAEILARNETLKMTRFLPFRVTTIAFAGLMTLGFGSAHYASRRAVEPRPFELPDAWDQILSDPLPMALFFFAVLLMLIVASEFTWKTARQNVIDGLSKEQWFAGKLLVVPMLAAIFLGLLVGIGGLLAALPPNAGDGGTLLRAADLRLMGAGFLCMLGYGALAMLFATTIRSTGSAIGAFMLYAFLLERLLGSGIRRIAGSFDAIADFLPTALFNRLIDRLQWDAAALARRMEMIERLSAQGGPNMQPPQLMDNVALLAGSVAWILLLVALSFLIFRRRDL